MMRRSKKSWGLQNKVLGKINKAGRPGLFGKKDTCCHNVMPTLP